MHEWESRKLRGGTNFNLQRFLLIFYAGQTAANSTFGTIQRVMHNLAEY